MGIDKSINPFIQIWADYYIKPESFISDFSEMIIPLIPEFFDHPNVFLYGGSGTGKTMLQRYLSFDIQWSHYLSCEKKRPTLNRFFKFTSQKIRNVRGKSIKYLGLYYKLSHMTSKDFKLICRTKKQEQKLFEFYLDLEISLKFLTALDKLIDLCDDQGRAETIKSMVNKCIKRHSNLVVTDSLNSIIERISDRKREVDLLLSELWLSEDNTRSKKGLAIKVGGLSRLSLNLAKTLKQNLDEFKTVRFYILLDEYEGIEEHLKVVVNSMIRARNPFLELKINSRRYGITTFTTQNPNDYIIVDRDVKVVDLEHICRRHMGQYKKLLLDVARKRLEQIPYFVENNLMDVKKIIEEKSPEEEAKNIVGEAVFEKEPEHRRKFKDFLSRYKVPGIEKTLESVKCDENPLVEKLNMLLVKRRTAYRERKVMDRSDTQIEVMSKEYLKNPSHKSTYWYLFEKNKIALLFQLAHDYRKRKIYSGFDTFRALSGGFVAFFLQLCYHAWEFAQDDGFPSGFGIIDAESQTCAAEKVAWNFLETDIKNIDKVGSDIYYFVLNTGTFFRGLHLDELVREPEPTYFNTNPSDLNERTRHLITTAHSWSALQSKIPMKPKSSEEVLPDVHILHPVLAPAFRISYRTRGRTQLHPEEVGLLFSGSEEAVRYLLAKYRSKYLLAKRRSKRQRDLFED